MFFVKRMNHSFPYSIPSLSLQELVVLLPLLHPLHEEVDPIWLVRYSFSRYVIHITTISYSLCLSLSLFGQLVSISLLTSCDHCFDIWKKVSILLYLQLNGIWLKVKCIKLLQMSYHSSHYYIFVNNVSRCLWISPLLSVISLNSFVCVFN